jgi:GAF domain-containing protein
VKSVVNGETDAVANMANVAALVHESFGFWWTGFYIVKGEELVLGPFQGPVACTRIPFGKGVCGSAWKRQESIVVPIFEDGIVKGVLDIDREWMEKIVELVKVY